MLIKKADDIRSSEITPKEIYLNRRKFLTGAAIAGAAALTGLLQTEDGGRSWRCSAVPTNTYLVSAADPAHVWVTTSHLGDEATTLFSSEDGGLTWHAVGLSALS